MVTDKVLVATGHGEEGASAFNEIISVGNMDITCQNLPWEDGWIHSATGGFVQNEVLICGGSQEFSNEDYDGRSCWILGQVKPIKMATRRAFSAGIVLHDEVSNFLTGGFRIEWKIVQNNSLLFKTTVFESIQKL